MKKIINLLKIGEVDQSIIDTLKLKLELTFKKFNVSVVPLKRIVPLKNSEYNKKRDQYDAYKILYNINNYIANELAFRILGIVDNDIFSSSLNFVFGLAVGPKKDAPGDRVAALISITRLRESFYRKPDNNELFELRVLKEAIHELGHTFNLTHCNKFCIMQFSNSLFDTDKKPAKFCDSCLKKLEHFFKNLDDSF
ncbi:MAG: archaemetzincin family Zn-dependent metalloprotease [Candidatus Odinarchaeota archaeon]